MEKRAGAWEYGRAQNRAHSDYKITTLLLLPTFASITIHTGPPISNVMVQSGFCDEPDDLQKLLVAPLCEKGDAQRHKIARARAQRLVLEVHFVGIRAPASCLGKCV